MKEDLILQPISREEVPLYLKWMRDSEIVGAFVRQEASSLDDVYRDFDRAKWQDPTLYRWFFCSKGGERLGIGQMWKYDIYEDNMEIGRILLPQFRGKGLGTKTLVLLIDTAFQKTSAYRVQAMTASDHKTNLHTWERVGLHREGTLRGSMTIGGKPIDSELGAILRPEWEVLRKGK